MRRLSAIAVTTLVLSVGSCGGAEEQSSDLPQVTDPTSSGPDPEAVIEERWDEYWQTRIASENAGAFDSAAFTGVADGKAVESQDRRIRNYRKIDLVRVGQPQFRDAEVRLSDRSATVLACFNADQWTANKGGEPWSAKKYGWELTGSVMKQVDGTWFVVDEMSTRDVADMGKTC